MFSGKSKLSPAGKMVIPSLAKGFFLSLPILGLLLLLLTQADPAFAELNRQFFSNMGERIFLSLFVFLILFGLGISRVGEMMEKKAAQLKNPLGKALELTVILGGIVFLFAAFISVQFQYLFSKVGERELHRLGITSLTYSEYVRKGFFELVIVSAIASVVIIYVLPSLHRLKGKAKLLVQGLSALLTLQTGLIIFSASKRLWLYANAHGLTRARLLGFIALIWLSALLVLFLINVFRQLKRKQYFLPALSLTVLMFFSLNLINLDGLIADKYWPTVNNEIDYYYLVNLSTDAAFAWPEIVEKLDQQLTALEKAEEITPEESRQLFWIKINLDSLKRQTSFLMNKYGPIESLVEKYKNHSLPAKILSLRKWQSGSIMEQEAYRQVIKDKDLTDKINNLIERSSQMEKRIEKEIKTLPYMPPTPPLDRPLKPPLLIGN
jgi:hypothetical protein